MRIDVKSLIIGALISLVIVLALGAKQSPELHSCGRYQVEAAIQQDVYLYAALHVPLDMLV